MRILALSDILWRSTSLQKLTRQIKEIDPDLVLLAGDLVNDMIGFVGGETVNPDVYWNNVYAFLDFLNERKIQTFFIRGNWDNSHHYDEIIKLVGENLPYVKEISEKVGKFRGLKILGLSYSFTNDLKAIKYLASESKTPLDFVLAHAELKRRLWLFHLNTKLIITGHFDRQLCQINEKVFISLENYPMQYVVIDYESNKYNIKYFDRSIRKTVLWNASFSHGNLAWKAKPFKYKKLYAFQVEALIAAKTQMNIDRTERQEIINSLLKLGITKKHIEEYLQTSLH